MTPSDCAQLDHLRTAERSAQAHSIDFPEKSGFCVAFNHEESLVSASVACCVAEIASFVDDLVPRLHAGGRLMYVGAGISWNIALMNCTELPVTFFTESHRVIALVAGEYGAAIRTQEEPEDAEQYGATQIKALNLTPDDAVLGISASGRASFVLGALKGALRIGALTAGITKTSSSLVGNMCIDHQLVASLEIGKIYKGIIFNLRVGNHKLQARARRSLRQVCREIVGLYSKRGLILPSQILTTFHQMQNEDAANGLIRRCNGSVKLACAVAVINISSNEEISGLQDRGSNFGEFVAKRLSFSYLNGDIASIGHGGIPEYYLAIDGGGTKCAVSISTRFGVVSRGYAGPCNLNLVTAEEFVCQVKSATMDAITGLPQKGDSRPKTSPRFRRVWAGIAGLHHADKLEVLIGHLEKLLGVSAEAGSLRLTSDSALLGACLERDTSIQTGISIISGTGSVATAFKKGSNGHAVEVRRTGGWGHLIGDDGSAFHVGKQALQALLTSIEINEVDTESRLTEMEEEIVAYFGCTKSAVLSRLLNSGKNPTSDIGGLARTVTRLAFRDENPDFQALEILKNAAKSLAQLVVPLKNTCPPESSVLILSGALMTIAKFRELVYDQFSSAHITAFKKIVVINSASDCAVNYLAAQAI
ncbi:uncharacterized protein N7503_007644 [Penicillium pulvis]|uniref:uncharacterized protein n=1 Tax=Penicillium pulvis TaxID=1562058 RepID=UPI002549BFDF|nr:uncharacterized protein N7503_007644 [Penicillium pulvis]KAJ5798348.1 hypothetical protein N7503_007644 [Penicillium pulvis]